MTVKVFYSEQFKEQHEIEQFRELYHVISSEYEKSDEMIYILFNFYASEKQIDVSLLTKRGIAIVELKAYRGVIKGGKNGDWTVIDENKNPKKFDNLFLQLKEQKFDLLKCLNKTREENFKRINKDDLGKIQCWGYFEEGSTYNVEEQLGRDVKPWVDVITADNLIDKIKFIKSGYTLRLEDMDAIVKKLNLKEYKREDSGQPTKQPIQKSDNTDKDDRKMLDVLAKIGVEKKEISNLIVAIPAKTKELIRGLDADKIVKLIDTLIYIHVARNTYIGKGVLLDNFKSRNSVDLLAQLGLVAVDRAWRKYDVVIDSDAGKEIAQNILNAKIRALNFADLRSLCHPIVFWLCQEIVVNAKKFALPTSFPNNDMFEIQGGDDSLAKRLLNSNATIYAHFKKFSQELVRHGIVGIAMGYNSTHTWNDEYVFPEETEAILEPLIKGFDPHTLKKVEDLIGTIQCKYKAILFLNNYNPQTYHGADDYEHDVQKEIFTYLHDLSGSISLSRPLNIEEKVPLFLILDRNEYNKSLDFFKRKISEEFNAGIENILEKITS